MSAVTLEAADFAPDDFIMLRPALVRKMGGNVVGAMILTRIAYRCGAQHSADDGHKWWRSSVEAIADEVGLSVDQVKRAVRALIAGGYLVAKVDNQNGHDRTKSYRVNVLTSQGANSPHRRSDSAPWNERNRPIEGAESLLLLSSKTEIQELKTFVEDPRTTLTADDTHGLDAETRVGAEKRPDVEKLCETLASWMVKNGCKSPKIDKSWRTAARLLLDRDGRDLDKALHLIDWCQQDEFWRANVRSMPTFRKQYDALRLKALAEWDRSRRAPASRSGLVEVEGMGMLTPKNAGMFNLIAELRAEEEQKALGAIPEGGTSEWMRELEGVAV